jgi:hypothetical protein
MALADEGLLSKRLLGGEWDVGLHGRGVLDKIRLVVFLQHSCLKEIELISLIRNSEIEQN